MGCWVIPALSPPFQIQGENKQKEVCKPTALIPISEFGAGRKFGLSSMFPLELGLHLNYFRHTAVDGILDFQRRRFCILAC